jgi:hypothetical protein
MKETSLNGGKTRPLTEHGYAALAALAIESRLRQSFNAGIADRLTRGPLPLAEEFEGPNPFKTTQKQRPTVSYLRLTPEGQRTHAERVAEQARTNAKAGAR